MAELPDFLKRHLAAKAATIAARESTLSTATNPLADAALRARDQREVSDSLATGEVVSESVEAPVTAPAESPVGAGALAGAEPLSLFYNEDDDSFFTTNNGYDYESALISCQDVTDDIDSWAGFYAQEQIKAMAELGVEDPDVKLPLPMPLEPLPEVAGFDDDVEDLSLSTQVDADHLRRAAADAARLFNIMEGVKITLDPSQVAAVHGLVREQFGCLIGAAGTGKTTTTRALLHVMMNGDAAAGIEPIRLSTVDMKQYRKAVNLDEAADAAEAEAESNMERAMASRIPSIALVAYTGQATQVLRKNLPPAWRGNAMTIHSLLAFAPAEYIKADGTKSMRFEPTYTKHYKMPWDIIVVDEASMVNLELWHMLLDASKPGCRFYFIGDLNQLPPPVGMGILGFALAKWPVFELTTVHRQSDEAANRIIDTAWAVLEGKQDKIKFDDPTKNPNWRVIGFELDNESSKAHNQVVQLAASLRGKKVAASVDPEQKPIYDPWRDRIMTPGNGYNPEEPGYLLGQAPLNEALSQIFTDKSVPRIIIDAKRVTKKFAVGYRVMATKNEPPDTPNRITNGSTGKIMSIVWNPKWTGDARLFGDENDVRENRRRMAVEMATTGGMATTHHVDQEAIDRIEDEHLEALSDTIASKQKEEKQSGPASHVVEVLFDSGATRFYDLNAEVEQLMIAYASTTHKSQGAEMPTAIIVVHHANKFHLNRENLYTAVTRAKERVIILYTQFGLRLALNKQKVSGRNLDEKIRSYINLMGGENGEGFKTVNVRLGSED